MANLNESIIVIKVDTKTAEKNISNLKIQIKDLKEVNANVSTSFNYSKDIEKTNENLLKTIKTIYETGRTTYEVTKNVVSTFVSLSDTINSFAQTYALLGSNKFVLSVAYSYARSQILDIILEPFLTIPEIVYKTGRDINKQLVKAGIEIATSFNNTIIKSFSELPKHLNKVFSPLTFERSLINFLKGSDAISSYFNLGEFFREENLQSQYSLLQKYKYLYNKEINDIIRISKISIGTEFVDLMNLELGTKKLQEIFDNFDVILRIGRDNLLRQLGDERDLLLRLSVNMQSLYIELSSKSGIVSSTLINSFRNAFINTNKIITIATYDFFHSLKILLQGEFSKFTKNIIKSFITITYTLPLSISQDFVNIFKTALIYLEGNIIKYYRNTNFSSVFLLIVNDIRLGLQRYINAVDNLILNINKKLEFLFFNLKWDNIKTPFVQLFDSIINETIFYSNRIIYTTQKIVSLIWTEIGVIVKSFAFGIAFGFKEISRVLDSGTNLLLSKFIDTTKQRELFNSLLNASRNFFFNYQKLFYEFLNFIDDFFNLKFYSAIKNGFLVISRLFASQIYSTLDLFTYFSVSLQTLLSKLFSGNKITESISLVFQNILSAVNVILVPTLEKIAVFSNNLDVIINNLIESIKKFNYSEFFSKLGSSLIKFSDDLLYTINKYTGAVDFLKILSKTTVETGSIIGKSIANIGNLLFGLTKEIAKNTFTLLGAFVEYSRVLRAIFSGKFLDEFREKIRTAISSALAGGLGVLAFFKVSEKKQELIELGDKINKVAISISNFVGGLDKAQQILSEIQKYSAENPLLNTEQLLEATQLLVNYGIESEKIIQVTKEVAQVSSAVGSNINEVARIYGQVISKGQLYAEELQQFAERGVPIMKVFSELLGVSTREFQEMMRQGKITSAVFIDLFSKMANSSKYFGGIIEKQSQTITGIIAGINDNIKIIAQSFGAVLGDMLKPFASVMLKVTDAIRNFVLFLKDLYFSLNENTRAFIGTIGSIVAFTFQVLLLGSSVFMMYRGFKILTSLLPFFTGILKSIITSLTSLISVQSIYITQQEKIILNNALQTLSFSKLVSVISKVVIVYGVLILKMLIIAGVIAGIVTLIYKYVQAKKEQEDAIKNFINTAGGIENVVFHYENLTSIQKEYIKALELKNKKEKENQILLASHKKMMQNLSESFKETIAVSTDLQKSLVKINAIKINQKGNIIFNPELIKSSLDKMLFYLTYFGVVIWEFFKRTFFTLYDNLKTTWEIAKQITIDTGKTFIKLGEIIFNVFKGNVKQAKKSFTELENLINDSVNNISNQFTSYFARAGNQFATLFDDALKETNNLFSKYKIVSNVVDKEAVQQQLNDLKDKVFDTFEKINEETKIEIHLNISDEKLNAVKEVLDKMFLSLSAFRLIGFSDVESGLSVLGERAFRFSGVADDIANKLANINIELSNTKQGTKAFQDLTNESNNLQNSLSKLKNDFGKSFGIVIQSIVNGLQDLFKAMESNFKALQDSQNRLMEWVNYVYDGLLENLNSYYDDLKDKNKETYNSMLEDIQNFYDELELLGNEEYQRRKRQIEQEYELRKRQLEQELNERLAMNEALSLTSYEQMVNQEIIYQDYYNQLQALEEQKQADLQSIQEQIKQENLERETEYLNQLAQQYGIYDQQQWEYLSNEQKRKLIEQKIKEEQSNKEKQLERDKLNEERKIRKERAMIEYMMTLAQFNMQKMMSLLNLRVQLALAMANIMAGISMAIAQTGIFSFIFVPMLLGLGAMIYSQITSAMGMVASIPPPPPPKELTMQQGGYVDTNARRETYDNVPARLQAGEFVINREKTQKLYEAIDNTIENNSNTGREININFAPQSIYIQGVIDENLINTISNKITYKIREAII